MIPNVNTKYRIWISDEKITVETADSSGHKHCIVIIKISTYSSIYIQPLFTQDSPTHKSLVFLSAFPCRHYKYRSKAYYTFDPIHTLNF